MKATVHPNTAVSISYTVSVCLFSWFNKYAHTKLFTGLSSNHHAQFGTCASIVIVSVHTFLNTSVAGLKTISVNVPCSKYLSDTGSQFISYVRTCFADICSINVQGVAT